MWKKLTTDMSVKYTGIILLPGALTNMTEISDDIMFLFSFQQKSKIKFCLLINSAPECVQLS